MAEIKYLNSAGLTAYDIKLKEWIKSSTVDITDDAINALFKNKDSVYFTVNGLFQIPVPQVNYNAIDLGLPSGLKWADRNVGASSPSDYGSYFSWGNVEGVTRCNGVSMSDDELLTLVLTSEGVPPEMIPSYIEEFKQQEGWKNEIDTVLSQMSGKIVVGYSFDETTYASTPGGQFTGSTLDAEHDAATVNMGSDWRMPTKDEIYELVDGTDDYGVKEDGTEIPRSEMTAEDTYIGMKLVSKTNGNSIFIPFAGGCADNSLGEDGSGGYVWSSSVSGDAGAYILFTKDYSVIDDIAGEVFVFFYYKYFGASVRGVCV